VKRTSFYDVALIVFLVFVALLIVSAFLVFNISVARVLGGGGDFLLPWKAARAFLFEQTEPYSGTVASFVQSQVYGRLAVAGQDRYILTLPFHLLLLYFPFGLFRDATIARGLWLFLSEAALLALTFFSLHLTDWRPHRLFLILFFLFAALSFYSLDSLFEGTPAIFLGLIYVGILLSLRLELDELAGALIALSLYQWEIGSLFLFFIALRVFHERRWRVLAGFLMISIPLLGISFFVYPGWILPFVRGVFADWLVPYGFSPGMIFMHWWPELGSQFGWALTGVLLVVLIAEWSSARDAEFNRFYWASCLTLAFTPLFGFRSEIQNLAVLLPPLALIFAIVRERWKAGYWLTVALLLFFFAAPWYLLLKASIASQQRDDLLFLFLPVFTVIGLYWIRWWAIRPPRTWLERATRSEYR